MGSEVGQQSLSEIAESQSLDWLFPFPPLGSLQDPVLLPAADEALVGVVVRSLWAITSQFIGCDL